MFTRSSPVVTNKVFLHDCPQLFRQWLTIEETEILRQKNCQKTSQVFHKNQFTDYLNPALGGITGFSSDKRKSIKDNWIQHVKIISLNQQYRLLRQSSEVCR